MKPAPIKMQNNQDLEIEEDIIEVESEVDFKRLYQLIENEDDIDIYVKESSNEI